MNVEASVPPQLKQKVRKSLRNIVLATPLRVAAPLPIHLQDTSPIRVSKLP